MGDGEGPERSPTLGMHHALGNALAILMRQLFDQLIVLQQQGASGPADIEF